MTAASATPQQMRDQLLQAIDGQSNQIHNMVAVMEVISHLEKYPITKEALEETRLGKLINDVRKKTTDDELAKRAKKLLRNWQKLIDPGPTEILPKGGANTLGSANGASHPCRTDSSPPTVIPASKSVPEQQSKHDIHNSHPPKPERPSGRKRKGGQRDGLHSIRSLDEPMHGSTPPCSNGVGGSPNSIPSPLDTSKHQSSDRPRIEHLDNDKHGKIPINAVRPHPSSPGTVKLPSTSSLLKTAVLQQQAKMDDGAGGGLHPLPRSPRCSSFSPKSTRQETPAKRPTTYAPKGTLSPAPSPRFVDGTTPVPSPLPSPQPLISSAQELHAEGPRPLEPWSSLSCHGPVEDGSDPQCSAGFLELPQDCPRSPKSTLRNLSTPPLGQAFLSEAARSETDCVNSCSEGKRRKRYRPRDYMVNLVGQPAEESTKPVRLKDRRLTFDPVTGQIKPLAHKESYQAEEPLGSTPSKIQRADLPQDRGTPLPSPFQQTNWKDLYRNEIIQSYLNFQSNVLTSSGAQTPGAHFFMTEYLKREEHHFKESRKTHVLVSNGSDTDLPGVSRGVTPEDLDRIHKEHWPGVNGCYDTTGNWYDWTQCISLDPHGDESKLNILPYVCLD
ncbi:hypothetical protein GJAV_G00075160 [Gymnothorax javanicus]|nr:hypothetical protein GJAV_G00075160 [Gymnothorax javanicus]